MPELKILANVIDFMEANGLPAKVVRFAVDQRLADEINKKHGTNYSVPDLEKAVDKCVTNDWISHQAIGEKYMYLGITSKGVGAARSRARAEEIGLDHRSGHPGAGVQGFSLGWARPRLKPWTPENGRWP